MKNTAYDGQDPWTILVQLNLQLDTLTQSLNKQTDVNEQLLGLLRLQEERIENLEKVSYCRVI